MTCSRIDWSEAATGQLYQLRQTSSTPEAAKTKVFKGWLMIRCEFCASEFQPPITGHWSSMEMYFHFLRHYKETCDEAEGGGLPEGRDEALRSTTVALITYYFKRKQLRRMENLANHYKILSGGFVMYQSKVPHG